MADEDAARAAERHSASDVVAGLSVAGETTVVSLRGEIDLLSAFALSDRLDTLTARPHPDLVLDLRSIHFIDCAGLGVLCRARNRVLARRGRLRLVTASASFRRLLWATGLSGAFEVNPRPFPARPSHGPPTGRPGAGATGAEGSTTASQP